MKLYDYQREIFNKVISSRSNDLVQLDTGAGKTPIEAALTEYYDDVILIAHRNILIAQISEKLAAFGIYHDTISTEHTRRRCMLAHKPHGRNYIKRGHKNRLVASIDSLLARNKRLALKIDPYKNYTIIIDEAHHVIPDNKWGRLKEIFPNARIIGFTATPARMDGESLHVKNGGLFDRLVQANHLVDDSVSKLISISRLSDFKVYVPRIKIEFNELAGDVIATYKKLANKKQAVAMCPSIKNAEEFAEEFKKAGIPSACISSNMSSVDVSRIIDLFKIRVINVLFNVDMVGEGFDVPGIEVLIMLRRTRSFIAYKQWVGRVLRVFEGKLHAIIIDHCENVFGNYENPGHGMPDEHVKWDLLNPPKGLGLIKCSPCYYCGFVYKLILRECPECKEKNVLHEKTVIGGHYVCLNQVDTGLVEAAKREYAKIDYEKKLESEIIFPYDALDCHLGRSCKKIKESFIKTLEESQIEIRKINLFLELVRGVDFWIKNFTIADVNNKQKHLKVFNKWQKLN